MRQPFKEVNHANNSNEVNTLNSAKTVFSSINGVHVGSLLDLMDLCLINEEFNNLPTLVALLRERLQIENFCDFETLFNFLNIVNDGTN